MIAQQKLCVTSVHGDVKNGNWETVTLLQSKNDVRQRGIGGIQKLLNCEVAKIDFVETIATDENRVLREMNATARLRNNELFPRDERRRIEVPFEEFHAVASRGAEEDVVPARQV